MPGRRVTLKEKVDQQTRELALSEARFRDVILNNVDGVLILDRHGTILFLNPAAEHLLGRKKKTLLGSIFGFPVVAGETAELDILRDDAPVRTVEMRVVKTRWEGRPALLASLRDITERKQSEQKAHAEAAISTALAQVGQTLMTAFGTPSVLARFCQVVVDVLDGTWGITYTWNPKIERYEPTVSFGVPSRAWPQCGQHPVSDHDLRMLLGRPRIRQYFQVVVSPIQKVLPPFLASAPPMTVGLLLIIPRGDGHADLQMVGYDGPRELTHLQEDIALGVGQIASLAFVHERLFEQLEHANNFKSDFLATMSHELRTPLSVIMGYADLLLEGEFGRVNTQQADVLWRMNKSARELLDVVAAALDVSRLEAGRMPVEVAEVDLASLVDEISTEMKRLPSGIRSNVEWVVVSSLPRLWADRGKLKYVLKNIIGYMDQCTEVGALKIAVEQRAGGIEFRVVSTGVGARQEELSHVAVLLQKTDEATSQSDLGLGLYTTRRLVHLLDGSLTLQAQPGGDATFTVRIPHGSRKRTRSGPRGRKREHLVQSGS